MNAQPNAQPSRRAEQRQAAETEHWAAQQSELARATFQIGCEVEEPNNETSAAREQLEAERRQIAEAEHWAAHQGELVRAAAQTELEVETPVDSAMAAQEQLELERGRTEEAARWAAHQERLARTKFRIGIDPEGSNIGDDQLLRDQLELEAQQAETLSHWRQHQEAAIAAYKAGPAGRESYAWLQCIQPLHGVEDVVVAGHQQHLSPFLGEVLLLPLGVASWLLTNRPTEWQQATVVPINVVTGTDPGSGLDTVAAISTLSWGYDVPSGQIWFTDDGDIGQNQSAWLYLDSNNQPWLVQ